MVSSGKPGLLRRSCIVKLSVRISAWKAIFRVERRHPQEVCAVALMIQKLDDNDAVSLFM